MTTSPEQLTRVLSRKQVLSIHHSTARINVWAGAVRSGKTVASLLRWLIYVASAPRGELVVVAKTSQTAMRNVFAPCRTSRSRESWPAIPGTRRARPTARSWGAVCG